MIVSTNCPRALTKTSRSKALGPKPGAKVIKPKRAKLISRQKIIKKVSSGLIGMTEKNLAEKAGHLELLQGGKKQKQKPKPKPKPKQQGQKAARSTGAKK
jgi:hypothetical protein